MVQSSSLREGWGHEEVIKQGVTLHLPQHLHWDCSHAWGDGMLLLLLQSQGKQAVCTCKPARLIPARYRARRHSWGFLGTGWVSTSLCQHFPSCFTPCPTSRWTSLLRPQFSQPGHSAVLTWLFQIQELIQSPQAFLSRGSTHSSKVLACVENTGAVACRVPGSCYSSWCTSALPATS